MSAIAGLWRFDGRPNVSADCARMLQAQAMYGPDDANLWSDGPFSLGRRLYRLLPEDAYDTQPLVGGGGHIVLAADVRIDNRPELIADLSLPRREAVTLCDAALLLAAFERWGEGSFDRIVGPFAAAIWDARARRLILVCDFASVRPLHYHCGPALFAFASMPHGLHALADIPVAPDERSVVELLAKMEPSGGRSYFAGISRVPAGHFVTVTRERVAVRRYWEPRPPDRTRRRTADLVEGLRHHLDRATAAQLRGAGTTVGTHLSGGLDSSAVTATAARLLAPTGGRVVAFTSVPHGEVERPAPPNNFSDEGPLAAATAALYPNVEHVRVSSDRPPHADLDRHVHLLGRPALNLTSMLWMYGISRQAQARKLRVVLTAYAGNLGFSYNGRELLPELLRSGRLLRLWREARMDSAVSGRSWRATLLRIVAPYLPVGLWRRITANPDDETELLHSTALNAENLARIGVASLVRERGLDFSRQPRRDSFSSRLWFFRRVSMGNYNKGMLAGWGIDHRDPTGDKAFIEYCFGIPTEHYCVDGTGRALARTALTDRLPPAVLNERRLGYQGADWYDAVGPALPAIAAEIERLSHVPAAVRTLDLQKLQRLVDTWPTEGWDRVDTIVQYNQALLRGLSAGHFLRKTSGTNA